MIQITRETQMLEGLNDIDLWNKLIKVARKYEVKKYNEEYTDLSSFVFFLGNLGHSINLDKPTIRPNYTNGYTEKDWKAIWKDVYSIYNEQFVEDLKRCLELLKKYADK